MKQFIITAFGKDRPGIVAGITKVLYEKGFNIEDSAMTRLNNEFTVMLVVSTEKSVSEEELKEALKWLEKEKDLTVSVKDISKESLENREKSISTYRLVVYGADKPGIVYSVAKLLADKGINIADLRTEKSNDLYVLVSQVEFPQDIDEDTVRGELDRIKDELNIDISLEKEEAVEM